MFQLGLPCYLGLNSSRSVPINVNKTRKHFSRNIHGARMFPQCFSVSHTGNIVSSVRFCFRDANYAEKLTKIRACEHEQASTHLIFNLRAIRAKAEFWEHLQMGWDHSIPLFANRDHEGHRVQTSVRFSLLGFHGFLILYGSFCCVLPRPSCVLFLRNC